MTLLAMSILHVMKAWLSIGTYSATSSKRAADFDPDLFYGLKPALSLRLSQQPNVFMHIAFVLTYTVGGN